MNKMQTMAILTNGGDTCALNASVEAIRQVAIRRGFVKIIGVKGGYHGLLYQTHERLDSAIEKERGGSILGSLRESPVKFVNGNPTIDEDKATSMVETLREYGVDVLVVIGGDGTLQATKMFHRWVQGRQHHEFDIIGFPKTIDNDIRTKTTFEGIEVSLCPGYPTAVRNIAQATRDIRTTARSAHRVFGVETMGRDAGWLAGAALLGGPDFILIPEYPLDESAKQLLLTFIEREFKFSSHCVMVVAEGISWADEDGNVGQIKNFEFGPRKLGGVVNYVMKDIEKLIKSKEIFDDSCPFGVRPHHTDYAPRAGSPCDYDLKLVEVLSERLGILLDRADFGKVPVMKTAVPYEELNIKHTRAIAIEEMEQKLLPAKDFYDRSKLITNASFNRFLRTITSGPNNPY